ncbi:hypothetical protein [Corallococcus macrosporus]|uniref:Lipoprotein n=1 Tax=Myxococcus fulvus (strain ATCC BAA-855 / HW-1) TaxID=483219 RepID=F8C9S0_MYXFH|nr:hypothetical protein [Corallococcus macrosporus]AEI62070.1 hypothetical protein LILAB_00690 [Corallococcus macrosporus]
MMPLLSVRALAAAVLLWSLAASAEPWNGTEPGVTTLQQVLLSFGAPTRQVHKDGEVVLTYQRKAAPGGTRSTSFHFDARQGVLRRIEVIPTRPPTPAGLTALYGPACDAAKPPDAGLDCREEEAAPARQRWWHYRERGLSVRLDARQRVKSMRYIEPLAPVRGSPARGPLPQAGSEGTTVPAAATPDDAPRAAPASGERPPDAGSAAGLATAAVDPGEAGAPAGFEDLLDAPAPTAAPAGAGPSGTLVEGWQGPGGEAADPWHENPQERQPDVLAVGGIYFQRAEVTGLRSRGKTSYAPVLPALADIYLDATPSKHVRGFMMGRLAYDPLSTEANGPAAALGQMWLKFDVAQRLFVTAGRQEIRWGSSQIWNPTDFLQAPNPDPLNIFDLRTGVDMVRVTVPWESMAANLSLLGTANVEDAGEDLRRVRYGGGVRAEMAVGTGEIAATAMFDQSRRPRYGLDATMALGLLDFNAELAWVGDGNTRLWARQGDGFVERTLESRKLLVSAGVSATFNFAELYRAVVRVEGFHNPLGYDDRAFLPWLSEQGDFRPLFHGRYYALGQVNIGRRGMSQLSLIFTTIANVQDASYLSRLAFNSSPFDIRDIFVQTFVEVPYGERGSEFRFESLPADPTVPGSGLGVFRAGVSLYVRI